MALGPGLLAAGARPAAGQGMIYAPEPGSRAVYRIQAALRVTQRVLGQDNHFDLESDGRASLILVDRGERVLWRLEYDPLTIRIEGVDPSPRTEELRGTVVIVATTPRGVVLDALASGVVPSGLGAQYIERAATVVLPHLPGGGAAPGSTWVDTLRTTEIVQGVTAEVRTVVAFAVSDTSAWAGRAMVPVTYRGTIEIAGTGTMDRSRVTLEGAGSMEGHYLYDPRQRLFALHVQEQALDSTLTFLDLARGPLVVPSRQVLRARAERLY